MLISPDSLPWELHSSSCVLLFFESSLSHPEIVSAGTLSGGRAGFQSVIVGADQGPQGGTEINVTGRRMYPTATRSDFSVGPTIFSRALEIILIHHPPCS